MSGEIDQGPLRPLSHVIGHAANGKWGRAPGALIQRPRTKFETVPVMAAPPTIAWVQARGATAVAIASGGTGYVAGEIITLAGGTNNGYPTRIWVSTVSGGVITAASIHVPGVYSSTMPTNPMAQAGSTGAGTGATFNITYGDGSGSPIPGQQSFGANTMPMRATASAWGDRGTSWGNTTRNDSNVTIEFWTDSAIPTLRMQISNQRFTVRVDGEAVQSAQFAGASSGNIQALVLDWGGVRKPRRYEISGYNSGYLGIRVEADATVWAPDDTQRPLLAAIGDSYTQYTGADVGRGWVDVMARGLDMDVLPYGIGGSGWLTNYPAGANAPETRVADWLVPLHAVRPVAGIVIALGYNDSAGTQANIQASCANTLEDIVQALPNVPVYLLGPWTPLGSTANLTTTKATMQAALAAVMAAYPAALITFIDIDNIVSSANKAQLTGGDNVHPSFAGHAYLGARIGQKIHKLLWP